MKLLACLPLLLLTATSPARPVGDEVAPATFRFWRPADGRAAWTSAGIRIEVAPAPCDTPPRTEGCRWDAQNNQAEVTMRAPGAAPVTVRTDDQASYYRIAVARFEAADPRPGVAIENDSGGSAGEVRVQLFVPAGAGYRQVVLPGRLEGELPPRLTDISGDGAIDFVLGDGRFDSAFGCNACTPRPPVVLTLRHGVPVDVSRAPAYAAVFRADLTRVRATCLSDESERNGACAAYAADAARLGRFDRAWAEMLHAYDRRSQWGLPSWCRSRPATGACPPRDVVRYDTYPEALRHFLVLTGYIAA